MKHERLSTKHETSSNIQIFNTKSGIECFPMPATASKKYDLEERTEAFADAVRTFLKRIPPTFANIEDGKQLLRSSGSVAANYIEANDSLGTKDFMMHIKICRKEAKESGLWLRLIDVGGNTELEKKRSLLAQEAKELMLICASIFRNSNKAVPAS